MPKIPRIIRALFWKILLILAVSACVPAGPPAPNIIGGGEPVTSTTTGEIPIRFKADVSVSWSVLVDGNSKATAQGTEISQTIRLEEGKHVVSVYATNQGGTAAVSWEVLVDTTPPTASVNAVLYKDDTHVGFMISFPSDTQALTIAPGTSWSYTQTVPTGSTSYEGTISQEQIDELSGKVLSIGLRDNMGNTALLSITLPEPPCMWKKFDENMQLLANVSSCAYDPFASGNYSVWQFLTGMPNDYWQKFYNGQPVTEPGQVSDPLEIPRVILGILIAIIIAVVVIKRFWVKQTRRDQFEGKLMKDAEEITDQVKAVLSLAALRMQHPQHPENVPLAQHPSMEPVAQHPQLEAQLWPAFLAQVGQDYPDIGNTLVKLLANPEYQERVQRRLLPNQVDEKRRAQLNANPEIYNKLPKRQ